MNKTADTDQAVLDAPAQPIVDPGPSGHRKHSHKRAPPDPIVSVAVPQNCLAALLLFAAKNDIRPYLNGLLLEVYPRHAILIATDGHMLGAARIRDQKTAGVRGPDTPIKQIVLKNEWLSDIKPSRKGATQSVTFTIGAELPTKDEESEILRPITIWREGQARTVQAEVRRPLEWERTVPRQCSGVIAQFDPRFVARLGNAYAALHGIDKNRGLPIPVLIAHNGGAAALVDFNDPDFFGVLMPMRGDVRDNNPLLTPPAWVFPDAAPVPEA